MIHLSGIFRVFFASSFLMLKSSFSQLSDSCRRLEFKAEQTFNGRRLKNHMIQVTDILSRDACELLCYMEPNCVSYNFMESNNGKHSCELNNSTFEGHEEDLVKNSSYIYLGAKNACLKARCMNNATCQTGFTDRGYRCLCTSGFEGEDCERDTNECDTGTHTCSVNAECINTQGSYQCTCKPRYDGDGRNCHFLPSTCKEVYDNYMLNENKDYSLNIGSEWIQVYCHMDSSGLGENGECGGGGWTLVMKIDGSKTTFHYDSHLWSVNETFNQHHGTTGFDERETKLPTYWSTPFSRICLGFKVGGQLNFIVINTQGDSLYSLIADGKHRATALGRDTWKKLIGSQASLQRNCNKEGFNAAGRRNSHSRTRIGFLGNNENDCGNCDSRIGFGTGGAPDNSNTCGNVAQHGGDNGNKNIQTTGYILVQ